MECAEKPTEDCMEDPNTDVVPVAGDMDVVAVGVALDMGGESTHPRAAIKTKRPNLSKAQVEV